MITQEQINEIKKITEQILQKMTITPLSVSVNFFLPDPLNFIEENESKKDLIKIEINIEEPQMFIGRQGQTLFELQRLLRIIANKKIKQDFFVDLDINQYKKKKTEYLKNLAKDTADQAVATRQKKSLPPMPPYERRIIHSALADRRDVITVSKGEKENRLVVIFPRD